MIMKSAVRIARIAAVALPAAAVTLVAGCSNSSSPDSSLKAPCAVIVDGSRSGSVFDASTRVKQTLQPFLAQYSCKQLAFVPLNASSVGSVCYMPTLDLSPSLSGDSDTETVIAERRGFALTQAQKELACARSRQPALSNGSDVLGALRRAQDNRPGGPAPYHVLVVSDMIETETQGPVDLYDGAQYSTPARRAALLSELNSENQIPDMHGMSLDITDLGAGLRNPVSSVNFAAFWAALFASSTAGHPQLIPPIRT